MEKYIALLIEDLHEIIRGKNQGDLIEENTVSDEESFLKHIEDVENYLHGEPIPVSEITGIMQEQLPPPEKLNEHHRALLAVELEKFLRFFHFALDFPQNYPHHLRYTFIRNFWKEKHTALQFGTSHIEFCSYEKENCPFPGYCTSCDDFEKNDSDIDMDNFKSRNKNDLPF